MVQTHKTLFLQMPIHSTLYVRFIPLKSIRKFLNIWSLPPAWIFFQNLFALLFSMPEAKENTLASGNSALVQNKSPKCTGIFWDLHHGVQGMAVYWCLGPEQPTCCPTKSTGKEEPMRQLSGVWSMPTAQLWGQSGWEKAEDCTWYLPLKEKTATAKYLLKCIKIKLQIAWNILMQDWFHIFLSAVWL